MIGLAWHPCRRIWVWSLILLLPLLLLGLSVCVGSSGVGVAALWGQHADAALTRDVIWQLRLPRSLSALAVGGLLALAGVLQQVLLRNPLADPYVLGTSGGAGVGALLAMLLGAGTAMVSLAAGGGAWISTVLVFVLARNDHSTQRTRLLLTGVAVASFASALIALILSIAPDGILRGMIFWMLGDLAGADWHYALPGLLALLALVWPWLRDIDMLAQGEARAHALGVSVRQMHWLLYTVSAMATALAVTTAGAVGFVGLIVPHALRLLLGSSLRQLLPASVLCGGAVLLAADIVARTAFAPQQLPVGVVMAICGVPAFLYLLARFQGRR
ncbi:iron ABC transporter permease [Burkholderiaceae bacterium DAT-1]|nr:iron ABC transporter permease [Burkholderiaceae bacterium DAT-1]